MENTTSDHNNEKYATDSIPYRIPSENDVQIPILTSLKENDINYKMDCKNRGNVIIFNHYKFDDSRYKKREGTKTDCDKIHEVFQNMGFVVIQHDDLTRREIEDELESLNRRNFEDDDCLIIFILTHGCGEKLMAKDKSYSVENLYESFKPQNCPGLAGKPKLFFINACRGDDFDKGVEYKYEVDSARYNGYSVSSYADFLIMHSTAPGIVSVRHEHFGSPFVQSLCDVLNRAEYRRLELMEILRIVTHRVALLVHTIVEKIEKQVGVKAETAIIKHRTTQVPFTISTLIRSVFFKDKITPNMNESALKRNADLGECSKNMKLLKK